MRRGVPHAKARAFLQARQFHDHREVEILVRMALRQRPWQDGCTPDPDMVELADQVIKCGLAHLNKDAFMLVLSSSFLIDVQASYQSGFTTLQVRHT